VAHAHRPIKLGTLSVLDKAGYNERKQNIIFRVRNVLRLSVAVVLLSSSSVYAFSQNRPIRFWNLTRHTISEFYLAPQGTSNWGPNQCKNDKDGTVDSDERLRITGITPGVYDAKLADDSGRVCIVRNIKIETGEIFSIEEKDLTSCTP
jgi:hypothetical protein